MHQATERLIAGSLIDIEFELERSAVEDGVKRYRELAQKETDKGNGANLKPGERLVGHWFRAVSADISKLKRSIAAGAKIHNSTVIRPVLNEIHPDVLAVIALNQSLGMCLTDTDGITVARLTHAIGRAVLAELLFAEMKDHDKYARRRYRNRMKEEIASGKRPDPKVRMPDENELLNLIVERFRASQPKKINWWARRNLSDASDHRRACIMLGERLLWSCIEWCTTDGYDKPFQPAFRRQKIKVPGKKYRVGMVELTDEAIELVAEGHAARELMRPQYQPMVVEPMPATRDTPGGYIRIRTPLVSKPSPELRRELAARTRDGRLDELHFAHWCLQSTPLAVNTKALDDMKAIYKQGGNHAGVPHADNLPPVPKPNGYRKTAPRGQRWKRVLPDDLKDWKAKVRVNATENRRRTADRKCYLDKITVAERFAALPMWFPCQGDFRFRQYAIPAQLNHQGDDISRGLLLFKNGIRPGPDGPRYLKIHAANMFGKPVDKQLYHERVAWVDSNLPEIKRIAKADEPSGLALQAENPWQFVAACRGVADPDGIGRFVPCQWDGSCNGLQHYAMLGRDPIGAAAVNLLPTGVIHDPYTIITEMVLREVMAETNEQFVPIARVVERCILRKTLKTTVLADTYGVTESGARQQIRDEIVQHGLTQDEVTSGSEYLAKITMKCLAKVSYVAAKIMAWLRACALRIATAGHLVRWTTPFGFPVIQGYRKDTYKKIKTVLQEISYIDYEDEKAPVRVKKQISSIAANFIHSLDSTHAHMVAAACRAEHIEMMLVHDNFWFHAGNSKRGRQIVLEQLVRLYTRDILAELAAEWAALYPEVVLPPPPKHGTLDITRVLGTEQESYAFQ